MLPLPFLELPVSLPGLQNETVNNPDKVVVGKFLPTTIVAYHESYYPGVIIYLQNGQPFLLSMNVDEYEKAIKQYFKLINTPSKIQKLN